jgi:transcriptional regulator with XRE-family HTH domain
MTNNRITDTRFYNELGSNIRLAREAAGKSQNDVAGHLDVTFQQVQKYEKGSNRIPIDRLIALSEYLDISLPRFFDFMELPTDDDELNGLRQTLTGREFRLLLHGWHAVKDRKRRAAVLDLVKLLAA